MNVNEAHVSDSSRADSSGACGCVVLITVGWLMVHAVRWLFYLFDIIIN